MTEYKTLTAQDCAVMLSEIKKAAVAAHRSPDADATGSAIALCEIIRALGGEAHVLSADPIPEAISFLAEGETILDKAPEDATLIAVDVASPAQLGDLAVYLDRFAFMIDHHERGEVFAPNYVIKGAAAAGELIYYIAEELIKKDLIKPTKKLWNSVFAAISGDTGSFRFGNTTPEAFAIASQLKKLGADTETISHKLHAVRTKSQLRAEKIALLKMKYFCDEKIAVAAISKDEMEAEGLKNEDLSEISDKMRSITHVLVGVSLRECERGEWRVSLRANVPVDCASVAVSFGGGGHVQAAGCSIKADTEDEALSLLIPKLKEAVTAYEESTRN